VCGRLRLKTGRKTNRNRKPVPAGTGHATPCGILIGRTGGPVRVRHVVWPLRRGSVTSDRRSRSLL